jgi:YbbR domain-containing protein
LKISIPLTRLFRNWPAKVLSFALALLLLIFHDITRLEERFVTVSLEVRLTEELVPASPYPQQVRLRLRGESEQVYRVVEDDLRAYIDLEQIASEGEHRVPVNVERQGISAEPGTLEISVEPAVVTLTLEEKAIRSVEVQESTSGFVPSGFELERIIKTPSSVEIEGPRTRVERVEFVRTEDVDLTNRREDFTERIRLVSPDPLIRFRGGDIVELRGIVAEAVVLQTFEPVDMVVSGLDPDFALDQELPAGLIRVQARQVDIERLSPGDVQLSIDAATVSETGALRLPVRPIVPAGFVVLRYEPTSIQLVVVEAP